MKTWNDFPFRVLKDYWNELKCVATRPLIYIYKTKAFEASTIFHVSIFFFFLFFKFDLKINLISAPPNTRYSLFKTKKRKILSSYHTLTSPSPKPKTHSFLPPKSKPKTQILPSSPLPPQIAATRDRRLPSLSQLSMSDE